MQPTEAKQKDERARDAMLRRHRISLNLTDDEMYRLGYLYGWGGSYSKMFSRLINEAYNAAKDSK